MATTRSTRSGGGTKAKATAKAKATTTTKSKKIAKTKTTKTVAKKASTSSGNIVEIEHWTRAAKLEKLLKEAIPGVSVDINKEKPRKGCFEVRAKGKAVVTFGPGMPRPFKPLRNAVMEDIAAMVVKAV